MPTTNKPVSNGEARRLANLQAHAKGANTPAITAATLTQSMTPEQIQASKEANAEITAIQALIADAITTYVDDTAKIAEAKSAYTGEQDASRGRREKILINLASVSSEHEWTSAHIRTACDRAAEKWASASNSGERNAKVLGQFTLECWRAMHPRARDFVQADFDLARDSFAHESAEYEAAEKARKEDPSVELPAKTLAKVFQRQYHAVAGSKGTLSARIGTFDNKGKQKSPPITFGDLWELAEKRVHAERTDNKRAARMIAHVLDTLTQVHSEFPAEKLANCITYLSDLEANVLQDARNAMLAKAAKAAKAKAAGNVITGAIASTPKRKPVVLVPTDVDTSDDDDALEEAQNELL